MFLLRATAMAAMIWVTNIKKTFSTLSSRKHQHLQLHRRSVASAFLSALMGSLKSSGVIPGGGNAIARLLSALGKAQLWCCQRAETLNSRLPLLVRAIQNGVAPLSFLFFFPV